MVDAARSPVRDTGWQGPLTIPFRLGVGAAWLAFVWATTHWYSWQRTVDLLFGSDMPEYERVARAAPGFPSQPLPSQHADRFVPHYLVGLVSDALHVGVRPVYYVCAFLLLLAILALFDRLVQPLGLGRLEYALCVGAVVGNPYIFRFLAVCPARLADSVFIVGGLVALLGLLRANPWLLVAGLLAATLGRSEAVFPLVVLAPIGVALPPAWRARTARARGVAAAAAFALPLVAYALIRVADHSFSVRDHPGFWGLTIFGTFRDLPGSAHLLGVHVARILVGIAGGGALIVGALAARRLRKNAARLPFEFWAALAAGTAISGEALVLNPAWIKGSEPLLSALGAVFFACAGAVAVRGLAPGARAAAIATIALLVISLHHRFSAISPVSTPSRFAALTVAGAIVVAAAVAIDGLRRRAGPGLG